jgi:AraC-like DNA-binding protein
MVFTNDNRVMCIMPPLPDITSDTYQRRIWQRPDVGATATVRQDLDVRISSLLVLQPSLIVVEQGHKTVHWDGGHILAGKGEAVWLSKGRYDVINEPAPGGAYEAFWLAWTPASLDRRRTTAAQNSRSTPQAIMLQPEMTDALQRAHLSIGDPKLPDAIALHRMEEVLYWLGHLGIRIDHSSDITLTDRVSTLIASDPGHPWTLQAVASRLIVSEATLRRTLSDKGTGFTELLIDARMSAALSLLQSTDYPVDRIALEVGYASPSRFSVRFRARFGFAPTAIRGHKRLRKFQEFRECP